MRPFCVTQRHCATEQHTSKHSRAPTANRITFNIQISPTSTLTCPIVVAQDVRRLCWHYYQRRWSRPHHPLPQRCLVLHLGLLLLLTHSVASLLRALMG